MVEKMQFTALVVLTLLMLTLMLLPRRVVIEAVPSRSRWMMACGTGVLALQFLLQVVFNFRAKDPTEAILINLFLFVPAAWLYSVGILYLQRKGKVRRRDWFVGPICWVTITLLLTVAYFISDEPQIAEKHKLHVAGSIATLIYLFMQCHYTYLHFRELRRIHRALNNFYDRDMSDLLRSMERAMEVLALFAVMVPVVIYDSGWILAIFGLLFLGGIFYFILSFVCYVVGNDGRQVMLAELHADEKELDEDEKGPEVKAAAPEMEEEDRHRIESVVNRWLGQGKHLRSGITIQAAADEMKIPRYQLSTWLKTTDQELFSPWLTHLRIEEAKHLMTAHPDWSNDVIAEHCGFGSRTYFQTVFRKQTNMTPAEFVERNIA